MPSDKTAAKPVTLGAHHVGLTVLDVEKTSRFFIDTLGFEQVAEKPAYPAIFVSDGTTMLTLWQVKDPATATAFDRKNVIGLHHLALKVDGKDMDALHDRLRSAEDVTIEFAPEPLGTNGAKHMLCTIPSGIRLEFIAPAG